MTINCNINNELIQSYSLTRSTPESPVAAQCIKVPDVLADVFESIAGAIFIDSEGSLAAVQKCFQPFFDDANGNKKSNFKPPAQKN